MNLSFRKLQCLREKRGYTLVECMIAVFIFVLISSAMYTTMAMAENIWSVNKVKVELQQELRQAMEWMINDIRQAGNTSITNVPANGTSYTTITFKKPTGVTSGSLQWDTNTVQFVRGGTGSVQLQRIYAGTTKILAQRMSSLSFRRLAATPDTMEISMAAQSTSFKGVPVSYQLDFKVNLRN